MSTDASLNCPWTMGCSAFPVSNRACRVLGMGAGGGAGLQIHQDSAVLVLKPAYTGCTYVIT